MLSFPRKAQTRIQSKSLNSVLNSSRDRDTFLNSPSSRNKRKGLSEVIVRLVLKSNSFGNQGLENRTPWGSKCSSQIFSVFLFISLMDCRIICSCLYNIQHFEFLIFNVSRLMRQRKLIIQGAYAILPLFGTNVD